jgi:hypothetical protein
MWALPSALVPERAINEVIDFNDLIVFVPHIPPTARRWCDEVYGRPPRERTFQGAWCHFHCGQHKLSEHSDRCGPPCSSKLIFIHQFRKMGTVSQNSVGSFYTWRAQKWNYTPVKQFSSLCSTVVFQLEFPGIDRGQVKAMTHRQYSGSSGSVSGCALSHVRDVGSDLTPPRSWRMSLPK